MAAAACSAAASIRLGFLDLDFSSLQHQTFDFYDPFSTTLQPQFDFTFPLGAPTSIEPDTSSLATWTNTEPAASLMPIAGLQFSFPSPTSDVPSDTFIGVITPGSSDLDGTTLIGAVSSPDSQAPLPGLTLPAAKPKRGRPPANGKRAASPIDEEVLVKRQRNNVAAKKYRQKKIDRIEELEEEVDAVKKERDELRIKLARQEAETAALREMLKLATAKGG
ncbi:hypothetical protein OQA88_10215 [Cercophora sp. LCS_1]